MMLSASLVIGANETIQTPFGEYTPPPQPQQPAPGDPFVGINVDESPAAAGTPASASTGLSASSRYLGEISTSYAYYYPERGVVYYDQYTGEQITGERLKQFEDTYGPQIDLLKNSEEYDKARADLGPPAPEPIAYQPPPEISDKGQAVLERTATLDLARTEVSDAEFARDQAKQTWERTGSDEAKAEYDAAQERLDTAEKNLDKITSGESDTLPPSPAPPSEATQAKAEAAKKSFDQARQDWAVARQNVQKAQNELDNADWEFEYATSKEEQNKALDKINVAEDKLAAAKKKEQEERAAFNDAQWTFTGIVSNILTSYRRYAGLSGISSLIFDEKFLADWKTSVNEFFCKTIVLGGIDCWASKICGQYTEIAAPRDGVLFTSPVGGAPDAVAHIEGMRSLPIETPNGTVWVYTVTFGLTNPEEDDEMSYNVVFGGERSASWWQTPPTISSGASAAATGASALMKLSKTNYKEVCLTFSPEIQSFDGKEVGKICNDITQYAGGATAPYAGVGGNETTPAAATPSTPGTPGASI